MTRSRPFDLVLRSVLCSFATDSGRIVNRGDYFRVRQRVHPTDQERSVHVREFDRTVRGNSARVTSSSPSNSTSTIRPTIEYRPKVFYANSCEPATDDDVEETAIDDDEDDFSNERTQLLAYEGRHTSYFSRIRRRSRLRGKERVPRPLLKGQNFGDDVSNLS